MVLVPALPEPAAPGSNLVVRLEQLSGRPHATLARFRISTSSDPLAAEIARTPPEILSLVRTPAYARNASGRERLERYHLSRSPLLQGERERLASLKSRLDEVRPFTTVPVLRELAGEQRRKTRIQRRGNFLDLGDEVTEGLPAGLAPAESSVTGGRLALARWLVSRSNPLTARVTVNRYWESLFGIGIVRTSEEFGAQGELPSHPELLDWLAVE
ncbi:MAG TPA: hypothetical protein DCM86_03475, partial [Verrucomicrobiales bacterium]|nr:hypothetical protein [Verrucomicrobiales bacterium]